MHRHSGPGPRSCPRVPGFSLAPLQVLLLLSSCLLLSACGGDDDIGKVDFKVPVSVQEVATGDVEDRIVATGTLRAVELVSLQVETGGVLQISRGPSGRRRFEAARSDLEATRSLFEQGLITDSDLRNAETAVEDARIEYDRSLLTEVRTRLVTPIDGVILRLARDSQGQPLASGQLVATGLVVAQIAATGDLVADVDLVGPDVARVREGMPARVRHHAWEGRTFSGEVVRLAPMIDAVTRALRAEVEVDNDEGLLRPGMFVEVTIVGERREGVPVVPREAVADRGGSRVVFVLRGQRVSRREVVLGLGDDEVVEVREGLEPGERVVTRGLETLTDQTRVRVSGSS